MRYPFITRALLLTLSVSAATPAHASPNAYLTRNQQTDSVCLPLEPVLARVVGRIVIDTKYGPPNYGESPKTDRRLRIVFIDLRRPVSVCASKSSSDDGVPHRAIVRIQLSFTNFHPMRSLKTGDYVAASGTVFVGFSGYHFADVVMTLTSLKSVRHLYR